MQELYGEQQICFTADNIFKRYDINQSQKLQENEVETLLRDAFREMGSKERVTLDRVKLFINRVDKDGDYKISKTQLFDVLKQIMNR